MTFVIKIGDTICNFVSLCKSPNQSEFYFENFYGNCELTLDVISATNPFLLIVTIVDFIAKFKNSYICDAKTYERFKIETITSQFRIFPIINEPNHMQGKSASCIDLIFTPTIPTASQIS